MLAFGSALKGLSVVAKDGAIGEVRDAYFDDRSRDVRWLVIDTGTWLSGRLVLLPTSHLSFNGSACAVEVDLTRQQVEHSPHVDAHRPVSRQMETTIYSYYNWAPYWGAATPVAGYAQPSPLGVVPPAQFDLQRGPRASSDHGDEDPHLRSADEVVGYYVQAKDGPLGHIEDLLIKTTGWSVDGLAIDTKNWWPGRKVVLAAELLLSVSWGERLVDVSCTREEIKRAPEYNAQRFALAE